jgi:hypothetical protein
MTWWPRSILRERVESAVFAGIGSGICASTRIGFGKDPSTTSRCFAPSSASATSMPW